MADKFTTQQQDSAPQANAGNGNSGGANTGADVPVTTNAANQAGHGAGGNGAQGQLVRHADLAANPLTANSLAVADRIAREIDSLFEGFGLGLGRPNFARSWARPFGFGLTAPRAWSEAANWAPQTEVFERNGQLVVRADLPGLKKEDVHIDVEDDVLVIRGERKSEHEENRAGVYHSERSYGSFYRELALPEGVNPDQVKANFQNGVLEVTLPAPQKQEKRSRRIEIE